MGAVTKTDIREFFAFKEGDGLPFMRTYEECCEHFGKELRKFSAERPQHVLLTYNWRKEEEQNVAIAELVLNDQQLSLLDYKFYWKTSRHEFVIIFDPRKRKKMKKSFNVILYASMRRRRPFFETYFDTFEEAKEWITDTSAVLIAIQRGEIDKVLFLKAIALMMEEYRCHVPFVSYSFTNYMQNPYVSVHAVMPYEKGFFHIHFHYEKREYSAQIDPASTDEGRSQKRTLLGHVTHLADVFQWLAAWHYDMDRDEWLRKYRIAE